jgi:hypothetical protein
MEEIGCVVLAREKLQELESRNGHYRLHYWLSELVEGEPQICNDELTDLRWVTLKELKSLEPVFEEDITLFGRLLGGNRHG